ncbi:sialate O-acetylesterase [Portibacter lacus]|uniref:sialate O-acetylesterase n=1 Tax=Portibacter lacus TaxID=1099794 RepID=UPI0024E11142|nr:sialate O-acetylesterase [Portibacter lacus]
MFLIFLGSSLNAQISLPKIYGSNMVLPRNSEIHIQGKVKKEKFLTLNFRDAKIKTEVNRKTGEFEFILKNLEIGEAADLTITGKKESLTLSNVVVGDLWLCAGQSNMQYTARMLGLTDEEIGFDAESNIRLLNVKVATDYLPQEEIADGMWEEANRENIKNFSAVGYFFGQYLSKSQDVPIGLISSNLGATSIETWMGVDVLKTFSQFDEVTGEIESIGKDFKTLQAEFEAGESKWNKKYYHKGPGMEGEWWKEDLDESDWQETEIPMFWEYLGEEDHDGSFWFRKRFDIEKQSLNEDLVLKLNQIDDYDITWVNGHEVGRSFGSGNFRSYIVPKSFLKEKDNQLTVRVFDIGGLGGMYTNAFWGNKILNGKWKYKKGIKIDSKKFPKPVHPNGSIFSYPSLLYNGSIAPLHQLPVTGVIWYQGEANEQRGEEYEKLLSAMIADWRTKWKNEKLPFFIVQLANYRAETEEPKDELWPELRASQFKVSEMENVDIVTAIDIGEGGNIHPKNKAEVGRRLSYLALHYVYGMPLKKGPTYISNIIQGNEILVELNTYGSRLHKRFESEKIGGFAIAGEDGKFYWADAEIISDNTVKVWSADVPQPKYVRYAWSDNPGFLNLVNGFGLPVFPFRTDDFDLLTKGRVYQFDPHGF